MHAKIPSPEAILLNFGFVSVKVLNRYDCRITGTGAANMTGGRPRVLIVEKSAERRTALKDILRNGFQILEAENEREAAELLKKCGADLCVMLPDTYQDVTGQSEIYSAQLKRLERKASLDSLTGLLNHATAQKKVKQRMYCNRESEFAFLIFDLDYFKLANDTYGHQFGDKVLIYIAERLRSVLRKEDLAVRIGGDEFMVVMEYHQEIESVVDRIFHKLSGTYEHFPISLSMGISTTKDCDREYEALFSRADKALYTAKRSGRGRYVFYDDMMEAMFSVLSPIESNKESKEE